VSDALRDGLRKGLDADSLTAAIEAAKLLSRQRPDVGWAFRHILEEIERRWAPYDTVIPTDELTKVERTVCGPMLDILRELKADPAYDATTDLNRLADAYDAIK
jgi:hypothetical protein